ncbi:hypothetical protein LTR28_003010 [Elasticomyces elasticus]|nr:hypothetical protein LTR28_003010 [Elasticomyces elasticus]
MAQDLTALLHQLRDLNEKRERLQNDFKKETDRHKELSEKRSKKAETSTKTIRALEVEVNILESEINRIKSGIETEKQQQATRSKDQRQHDQLYERTKEVFMVKQAEITSHLHAKREELNQIPLGSNKCATSGPPATQPDGELPAHGRDTALAVQEHPKGGRRTQHNEEPVEVAPDTRRSDRNNEVLARAVNASAQEGREGVVNPESPCIIRKQGSPTEITGQAAEASRVERTAATSRAKQREQPVEQSPLLEKTQAEHSPGTASAAAAGTEANNVRRRAKTGRPSVAAAKPKNVAPLPASSTLSDQSVSLTPQKNRSLHQKLSIEEVEELTEEAGLGKSIPSERKKTRRSRRATASSRYGGYESDDSEYIETYDDQNDYYGEDHEGRRNPRRGIGGGCRDHSTQSEAQEDGDDEQERELLERYPHVAPQPDGTYAVLHCPDPACNGGNSLKDGVFFQGYENIKGHVGAAHGISFDKSEDEQGLWLKACIERVLTAEQWQALKEGREDAPEMPSIVCKGRRVLRIKDFLAHGSHDAGRDNAEEPTVASPETEAQGDQNELGNVVDNAVTDHDYAGSGTMTCSSSQTESRSGYSTDKFFNCSVCGVSGEDSGDGVQYIQCGKCHNWEHTECQSFEADLGVQPDFHFECNDCIQREEKALATPPAASDTSPGLQIRGIADQSAELTCRAPVARMLPISEHASEASEMVSADQSKDHKRARSRSAEQARKRLNTTDSPARNEIGDGQRESEGPRDPRGV